ncbi:hypothetical protein PR048_002090 [Dryococelus australis]|uniref:Uncharacterized protein n=1 Tax=Dryococelus australis TaxID=614101 RepID=A0ABQ9IJ78_9NEOP|nr:hypothetical protein PR048_002090 [Dryococelus australis]
MPFTNLKIVAWSHNQVNTSPSGEKFLLKEDYLFQNFSTTGTKWVLCIPNLYGKEVVECLHKEYGQNC